MLDYKNKKRKKEREKEVFKEKAIEKEKIEFNVVNDQMFMFHLLAKEVTSPQTLSLFHQITLWLFII